MTSSEIDIRLIDFAQYLADEAAKKIIPLFRNVTHETKADGSMVSAADKDAEEVMRKLIKINFPEHGIVAEEFGNENEEAEFVWVLDPIDGTSAFLAGRPTFGTLIGLLQNGKPVLGLMNQPITQERWVAANDETKMLVKSLFTRKCDSLASAFFATTSPNLFSEEEKPIIRNIEQKCAQVIYGGDCYNYVQLAQGNLDIVIESGLKPHDYLPLVEIVENAGGMMTDWYGAGLNLQSDGRVVACGDKRIHEKILSLLA
jgi:histidinol phosphatase-like enzyme (inositol monophosphatase family)